MTPLGPTVLNAREAKRRFWRATRRHARIIARSPAVDSPRPPLHRLLRRLRFARHRLRARSAKAPRSHWVVMPRPAQCRPPPTPVGPGAPPVLQITAPDNDASAAAELLLNTLLSYIHCDWEQAAPSRRQPFSNLSLYTNSQQTPTPRVVTAASNVFITSWQQY